MPARWRKTDLMRAANSVGEERFHHIVGGPCVEGLGNDVLLAVGGQEDDGQSSFPQDFPHQIDPVNPRQHHVQQDEMGLPLRYQSIDILRFSGHDRVIP